MEMRNLRFLTRYFEKNQGPEVRSFMSFVNAHVPEGCLQSNGVSTPRAVRKSLWNTLVKALED
jgi:hypothetical protein